MNISTKGRYGLRALLDLAQHYEEGLVSLAAIAQRQQISEGYLEQLMMPLRKAGLISSTRGAMGGYRLSRPPQEIKVGEAFRVLEGPLALISCISEDGATPCAQGGSCGSRFIWSEVQNAIDAVLDKYSLLDLLEQERGHSCSGCK
ncbi:MAG: Rrf2 family transcriptional regulator [Firmicutes bacterium]|nr:Rrf2 family transcriptional regulator [Bacillota bacterium]MBR6824109.1 Rrf2 family transcriptional regulator [Bacillota bacterium]